MTFNYYGSIYDAIIMFNSDFSNVEYHQVGWLLLFQPIVKLAEKSSFFRIGIIHEKAWKRYGVWDYDLLITNVPYLIEMQGDDGHYFIYAFYELFNHEPKYPFDTLDELIADALNTLNTEHNINIDKPYYFAWDDLL